MADNLKLRNAIIYHTEDINTLVFLIPTFIEISDTPFFVINLSATRVSLIVP
jgi:hypothetical protein